MATRRRTPAFSPVRIALAVQWGVAFLLILLAIAVLLFPELVSLIFPGCVKTAILFAIFSLILSLLAITTQRLLFSVATVGSQIQEPGEDSTVEHLDLSGCPDLAPLAKRVNGLIADVNTQRRTALDLLASNRVLARELHRFSRLLDSLQHGLLLLDTSEKIVFANRGAAPFLTVGPEEAQGQPARDCLKHPQVGDLVSAEEKGQPARGVQTIELGPDGDGLTGFTAVSHCHAFGEDERSVGQIVLLTDVTRIKNVERLQVEFMDSMAHELRTPLTSIRAYVEMLIDSPTVDVETTTGFYNVIYDETYRLSNLIDNLLDISMIEGGAAQLELTSTRMKRVLEDTVEVIRPQCETKQVDLVVSLPDRLPVLNVDKRLIGVALVNILGNAVKYTEAGGRVRISAFETDTDFRIVCNDSGIGIPAEALPRIFEKFYRGANVDGQGADVSGSGVGLATAMQIARHHGADIRVQSTMGEGSEFVLVFPNSLIETSIGE